MLVGQRIQTIYVSLNSYLESMHNDINVIDCTYMGGMILVIFEKTALNLIIHVEGIVEYRLFPVWELHLKKKYDTIPDDVTRDDLYFYDIINHELSFNYVGKTIRSTEVAGTDSWGFYQPDFNEVTAAKSANHNDLPTEVTLNTDICRIRFVGDWLEYFWILLEATNSD